MRYKRWSWMRPIACWTWVSAMPLTR
jgi:hypothetical protein